MVEKIGSIKTINKNSFGNSGVICQSKGLFSHDISELKEIKKYLFGTPSTMGRTK